MAYNYVKFQRGTLRAYQNLRNKDNDTLYFIYADENKYKEVYKENVVKTTKCVFVKYLIGCKGGIYGKSGIGNHGSRYGQPLRRS